MFPERLLLTAILALPLALGQTQMAVPIPKDPLEIVTGAVRAADTPEDRQAAVQLLARARSNGSMLGPDTGYHLTASFTVSSGGSTNVDGEWEMEEIHIPRLGTHWTARTSAGYATTQVSSDGLNYGEGTPGTVPLHLQEARAAIFGAAATPGAQVAIRTATATYNGLTLTCVLIAGTESIPTAAPGRRWDETEECVDPTTNLLTIHSQVPGRYYVYDYADGPRLGEHVYARKVTVTEAGKVVSLIRVDSLTAMSDADPKLFVATKEMKWSSTLASAQKLFVFPRKGSLAPDATIQPVCVLGILTSSGQLVEAHSLQPSDPNSQEALEYAKAMKFPYAAANQESQHQVFIIEKFPAPR